MSLFNDSRIQTEGGALARLQITQLIDISGDYASESPFVVKNITDDNVTVTGRLADMNTVVTTVLAPGWNPELFVELTAVPASTLQVGY